MTEATGEEAKTLHRLLEIGKFTEEKPNPDMDVAPIDADVIIMDEVSMVDIFLMNYVLKAIFKGTKLILVGDIDQLPSVGPGSVLKDFIESKKIPYITLNKIFRQAAKSKIIVNAHKVNDGIEFLDEVSSNEDTIDDFDFIQENNPKKVQEMILDIYDKDTQIITPTKKGDLGTKTLNQLIQEKYNPYEDYKTEKKFGDIIFREGDKVMQVKNNYKLEWKITNAKGFSIEEGLGVFNGDMGIIKQINTYSERITVVFDENREAEYPFSSLDELELAYAITIHKSQGSEYPAVVLPLLSGPPILCNRNLLYTAITRAQKCVAIAGRQSMVEQMIHNETEQKRYSGLNDCLKEGL